MSWDDLHALLPGLRGHDHAAWADVSALVYPVLAAAVAQAAGSGWADASRSDLVQDAWIQVREGFATFRGADTPAATAACFRAWVRRVARNVAHQEGRRRTAPAACPAAAPVPADHPDPGSTAGTRAARAEWKSRLEAAIAHLGAEEQLIVRRSLYEGVSCRQLAADLGLADHTAVAAWRGEILARLRRLLGDDE